MTSQGSTAAERSLGEHYPQNLCSREELLQESAVSLHILGMMGQKASLMGFTLK